MSTMSAYNHMHDACSIEPLFEPTLPHIYYMPSERICVLGCEAGYRCKAHKQTGIAGKRIAPVKKRGVGVEAGGTFFGACFPLIPIVTTSPCTDPTFQ